MAVELIEEEIKAQPDNFELQLRLAAVHAIHCKDVVRAEKIVRRLEHSPKCNPQQVAQARAKLAQWRALAETGHGRVI